MSMRRLKQSVGLCLAAILAAGCQPPAPAVEEGSSSAETKATSTASDSADAEVSTGAAMAAPQPSAPRADAGTDLPSYAAPYPGAELSDQTRHASNGASGGSTSFTTADSPEAVIAFYKTRAEAAGLRSMMAMNQGEARAYGAAGGAQGLQSLQVVAAPAEDGGTTVQLNWTRGG